MTSRKKAAKSSDQGMETSTTYEVRVLERDGNIRTSEFLDREVAVHFAGIRSVTAEVIGFYEIVRTKQKWREVRGSKS